jgi:hypothetical protein
MLLIVINRTQTVIKAVVASGFALPRVNGLAATTGGE